ncbi:hypothetical protein BKA65DRAFT_476663 [Rhexocercosporidium sp. MPI-PUGE-AT-0058]|nr:hypothetical protein BKA65DRAFT_476663 [Rhexocercosporidium sp. MPI-PUGE-AT-0058]
MQSCIHYVDSTNVPIVHELRGKLNEYCVTEVLDLEYFFGRHRTRFIDFLEDIQLWPDEVINHDDIVDNFDYDSPKGFEPCKDDPDAPLNSNHELELPIPTTKEFNDRGRNKGQEARNSRRDFAFVYRTWVVLVTLLVAFSSIFYALQFLCLEECLSGNRGNKPSRSNRPNSRNYTLDFQSNIQNLMLHPNFENR